METIGKLLPSLVMIDGLLEALSYWTERAALRKQCLTIHTKGGDDPKRSLTISRWG